MAKLGEILRTKPRSEPDPLDPAEEEAYRARIAERVARLTGSVPVGSDDGTPPLQASPDEVGEVPARRPDDAADGADRPDAVGSRPPVVVEPQRFSVPLLGDAQASSVGSPGTVFDPYPADPYPTEPDVRSFVAEPDGLFAAVGAGLAAPEPDVRSFVAEPDGIFAAAGADPVPSAEAGEAGEVVDDRVLPVTGDRELPDADAVEAVAEDPSAPVAAEGAPPVVDPVAPAPPVRRRTVRASRGTVVRGAALRTGRARPRPASCPRARRGTFDGATEEGSRSHPALLPVLRRPARAASRRLSALRDMRPAHHRQAPRRPDGLPGRSRRCPCSRPSAGGAPTWSGSRASAPGG